MNKDRFEIIEKLKNYFAIQELVGKATYKKYGERSWKFFNTEALNMLLIVREGIGKSITVNNWHRGGKFSQRGLRTNLQQIFKGYFNRKRLYLSGHVLGTAFDFNVEGMSTKEVHNWIKSNAELFPFKVRIEGTFKGKTPSWVHLDCIQESHNPKCYVFDV